MGNPNLKQKFVILYANFLLRLAISILKKDEDAIKDIILRAYKAL